MNRNTDQILDKVNDQIALMKKTAGDENADTDDETEGDPKTWISKIKKMASSSETSDDSDMKDEDISENKGDQKVEKDKKDKDMKDEEPDKGTGDKKVDEKKDKKDYEKKKDRFSTNVGGEAKKKVAAAFDELEEELDSKLFKEAAIPKKLLAAGMAGLGVGGGYLGGRAHANKLDVAEDRNIARQGIGYGYQMGARAIADTIRQKMMNAAEGGAE